jgi:hypothetical protein
VSALGGLAQDVASAAVLQRLRLPPSSGAGADGSTRLRRATGSR